MITEQKKSSILLTVVLVIFFGIMYYSNAFTPNTAKDIKIDPKVLMIEPNTKITSTKELEAFVMAMPDSPLKSCLLTCIGAAYGGDIDQLHIIMKEFSRLKIQELKTKNQI